MLQTIEMINNAVNNFVWGIPAMVCIIGVGLFLSLRTGFLQIRKFPYAIKTTIGRMFRKREASDGAMTPFQGLYRFGGNGRDGQYCRSGRCDCHWRSGSRILDVDFSAAWHVYEIFRSNSGSTLSGEKCPGGFGRRTDVLY